MESGFVPCLCNMVRIICRTLAIVALVSGTQISQGIMGFCAGGRANELVKDDGSCMVTTIILYLCPLYAIMVRRAYAAPPPAAAAAAAASVHGLLGNAIPAMSGTNSAAVTHRSHVACR